MHTTGDGGAIPQVRRSTYPHAYVHVHATGKAEYVLKCELSTMQKAMYRMIQGQGLCSVGAGGQIRISGLNNVEMQLRKVRSHPYLHFNRGPSPDPTPHPHPHPHPHANPDPDLSPNLINPQVCNHPYLHFNEDQYAEARATSPEHIYRTSGKFELLHRLLPKLQKLGHRVLTLP